MVADVHSLRNKASAWRSRRNERRAELGDFDILFLFVGQMIPRKGVKYLLDSFSELQKGCPKRLGLILVGDGPELEYLKNKKVANAFFMGALPYDRIAEMYVIADVFIIPTLEDNWSLVVPEAMACGLPVASSIYNGCWPELVTPDNGWTFDPLDHDDFLSKLQKIVADQERYNKMGDKSVEIVMNGYTPEHAANAIYNAVRKCF